MDEQRTHLATLADADPVEICDYIESARASHSNNTFGTAFLIAHFENLIDQWDESWGMRFLRLYPASDWTSEEVAYYEDHVVDGQDFAEEIEQYALQKPDELNDFVYHAYINEGRTCSLPIDRAYEIDFFEHAPDLVVAIAWGWRYSDYDAYFDLVADGTLEFNATGIVRLIQELDLDYRKRICSQYFDVLIADCELNDLQTVYPREHWTTEEAVLYEKMIAG